MAKTFTAAFAQTPRTAQLAAYSAVGQITGSTPTETRLLATAGTDGSIVTSLSVVTTGTTSGASVLAWISKDGGTSKYIVDRAVFEAYSTDVTTLRGKAIFTDITETTPLRLEAGDELYVGPEVSGDYHFAAQLTDY